MTLSVHTNTSAMIALQNLTATNDKMSETQNRISTGLAVNSAADNASVWSIAQGQRADLNSLDAVTDSLNRASSIADVASSAGSQVSDLLNQLREKVVGAMDTSIDTTSRNALNADYKSILTQITNVIKNASFNGANILDGSMSKSIQFIANAGATSTITLSVRTIALGGPIITLTANSSLSTPTMSSTLLTQLDTSINNLNANLGALGSQSKLIEGHLAFVSKLQDSITSGIGNMVDADMAKESANLQALQVQQQLGTQALSIANQSPQQILSLFK